MSRLLDTRLQKLEAAHVDPSVLDCVYIVHGHDETPEEAKARYFERRPEACGARKVYVINTGVPRAEED